jgi:hypothetical protein
MEEKITNIVVNRTENPNSFSFKYGKTATDSIKVYFDSADDLNSKLKEFAEKKAEIKENLIKISQIVE